MKVVLQVAVTARSGLTPERVCRLVNAMLDSGFEDAKQTVEAGEVTGMALNNARDAVELKILPPHVVSHT